MRGPYSVVLEFGGKPGNFTWEAVHAAFLGLCRRLDPSLAELLHSRLKRRPYALHLLGPRHGAGKLRLRLSVFAPEVFERFWRRWEARGGVPLRLGRRILQPQGVELHGPWAQAATWQELWDLPPARTVGFVFCTPTTFRQGDLHLPLPVPALIFRGLWEVWNLYAPKGIALSVETLERGLALSSFGIRSAYVFDGHAKIPGFVGQAAIRFVRGLGEEEARALRALAGFAFFSGVGRKTTHGMGLVRVEFGGRAWPSGSP